MCMYVCVCMCVFNHSIDRNFYPINTKFGTQVKKNYVKSKIEFEDGLCGFHRDPRKHQQKIHFGKF